MGLEHVRKTYEKLGREDPWYAILTTEKYRGNRWDPEEFFRRGREEIAAVQAYVAALGLNLGRECALDFGCGVGRLSQALADHFNEVVGVDISSTMIDRARKHDHHPGRVRYIVNTTSDLRVLPDASFDFIYSNKTLQHIPPENEAEYIREFVRVLRPGGLAIFQLRNGPVIRPGSLRARLYHVRHHYLRLWWKRIRGRPAYEMHFLARTTVEDVVREAGGRVVDVVDLSLGRPGKSLRFCVTR